jgi:hypothetical protein
LERVEVELDEITDDDDEQAKEPYNVAAELAADVNDLLLPPGYNLIRH